MEMPTMISGTLLTSIFALTIILLVPIPASHTAERGTANSSTIELVMFEELGCEYCDLWNEEIGIVYAKTSEGRFAPLKRVFRGDASVKHIKRIIYTPTFVVMKGNQEIGRIVGYPGEDFFWVFLDEILVKTGFNPLS